MKFDQLELAGRKINVALSNPPSRKTKDQSVSKQANSHALGQTSKPAPMEPGRFVYFLQLKFGNEFLLLTEINQEFIKIEVFRHLIM